MAEYIVNTDGEEARWSSLGANYAEYFGERATRFMGNKVMERVVRCKDCKWNEVLWAENGGYQLCVRGDVMRMNKPDGFCAWGERRE